MKKLFIYAFAAFSMLACSDKNTPNEDGTNSSSTSPATIEGELTGVFSVSPTLKVHFSKGNFQYQKSTQTCRFAEHQYDKIGWDNSLVNLTDYNGWIVLFGWGTGMTPDKTNYNSNGYGYGNEEEDISGTDYDWGVYNKISNGGNEAGLWRTLTNSEWQYIFKERSNASTLFGLGKVYNVEGVILLPDGWTNPEGLTFNASTEKGMDPNYYNSNRDNYEHNSYTETEWKKMEKAGAVFLPGTGYRGTNPDGNIVFVKSTIGSEYHDGNYWASTYRWYMRFDESSLTIFDDPSRDRRYGRAVRLVKDIK